MNKLIKPACLLLYLLSILVFFFVGASGAGILGLAEGQGLAGGAIIFMYGVFVAALALISALIFGHNATIPNIIKVNKILGIVLLLFVAFFTYRIMTQT